MTEQTDLTTLSAKELRVLASDAHIPHHARMGKDRLIAALKQVAESRAQQTIDEVVPPEAVPSSDGSAAALAPAPVAAEPEVLTPPPVAQDEPEVLDASALAGLADPVVAETAPAAPVAVDGEAQVAGVDGEPGEGERRRRRRRRRRRGGGRGNDQAGGEEAAGDDQDGDEDGPDTAEAAVTPEAPAAAPAAAPAPQAVEPAPAPAPRQDRRPEPPREARPPVAQPQAQPGHSHGQGHSQGHGHSRPQRPRLSGPQRPLPSVLDRLNAFARGILDLCSSETPTWAQPRLSELLAEAGLSPIPAEGAPHPDFHQVVGTVVAAGIPHGQIAEVVSPGFALRGDRGDLFPLKKVVVRLSGATAGAAVPAEVRAPVVQPRTPAPAPQAPVARAPAPAPGEPVVRREFPRRHAAPLPADEQQADAPAPEAPAGEIPAAEAPVAEAPVAEAPVAEAPVAEAPVAEAPAPAAEAPAPADVPATEAPRGREPRRDDRARGRRGDRGDRGDSAPAVPAAEAPVEAPRPVRPPSPGRTPEQVHAREPANAAPVLPLAHQATDELAARPKSEGFRACGLNDQILADLAAIGYQEPTPIQLNGIPVALSGKDMIGQAQTGTGKTAAFVLPLLQKLYALEGSGPVALILCPTRELARQVYGEFVKMAGQSGARAALIYGGVDMEAQFRALSQNPHVVIGTPGRVIDHMKRHSLDLSRLAAVVLDEADQMLDIGFWPDIMYVMSHTPPTRQILLFSATFPDPIRELAEKYMKEPERIHIAPKQVTADQVDQKYIAVPRDRKNSLLAHFIETFNPPQLVVFCKTKHQTDRVAEVLKRKNMSAGAIHGDLPQSKREKTLAGFRSGEIQCLVATNVAARGLDIPTVSHVVNYDVPEMPEEYVHRIGRTARNGAKGVARTFITPEDGQFLLEIEKHIGLLLEEERVDGFELPPVKEVVRTIAEAPVGTPRLLKPLVGGFKLGRRR